MLQHLSVLLVARGPKLNIVLKVCDYTDCSLALQRTSTSIVMAELTQSVLV